MPFDSVKISDYSIKSGDILRGTNDHFIKSNVEDSSRTDDVPVQ